MPRQSASTVRAVFGAALALGTSVYPLTSFDSRPASAAVPVAAASLIPAPPPVTGGVAEADGALFSTSGDFTGFRGLRAPVVGWTSRTGGGAWEVASDGGIFARRAPFYGSLGRLRLAQPIVGMAATPDGRGYWLVAGDGGIFAFGDAHFRGSLGRIPLARPIVAMAATPDGRGYWLTAADGGIFAFGDARFYGSLGRVHVTSPVVAMAARPGGTGYWLTSADGSVFAFGHSGYYGSGAGRVTVPAVGIAPSGSLGYAIATADGRLTQFEPGQAPRLALKLPVPTAYLQAAGQQLRAQKAVAVALAQVGKPYSLGGTGPYSFDCSGLTQFAYAAAGVALPRTAAEQFYAVPHVGLAAAQPGDLVFFYPGIDHVGIYLGDGLMVDAPHTGALVRVEQFTVPGWGPVMGVGRPG